MAKSREIESTENERLWYFFFLFLKGDGKSSKSVPKLYIVFNVPKLCYILDL